MSTYTVFCQQVDGIGSTIWISSVEAATPELAMLYGLDECATDWECDPTDVQVLGVCAGDVEVIAWSDSGYTSEELSAQGFHCRRTDHEHSTLARPTN